LCGVGKPHLHAAVDAAAALIRVPRAAVLNAALGVNLARSKSSSEKLLGAQHLGARGTRGRSPHR